jgi:hypothetical protein
MLAHIFMLITAINAYIFYTPDYEEEENEDD